MKTLKMLNKKIEEGRKKKEEEKKRKLKIRLKSKF